MLEAIGHLVDRLGEFLQRIALSQRNSLGEITLPDGLERLLDPVHGADDAVALLDP